MQKIIVCNRICIKRGILYMRLHNSYTNKVEDFTPIEGNKVKMYVCGPTVYDFAHLGHARCYITWDTLYRYLKFKGYDVTYCRNVTDVDDKILKKAEKEGKTPEEVSQYWYKQFANSMKALNTSFFTKKAIFSGISLKKESVKQNQKNHLLLQFHLILQVNS